MPAHTVHKKLSGCGECSVFIEFMLKMILGALEEMLTITSITLKSGDRLAVFQSTIAQRSFTRKYYLLHFKNISPATASRDLRLAVKEGKLNKTGDKRTSVYRFTRL